MLNVDTRKPSSNSLDKLFRDDFERLGAEVLAFAGFKDIRCDVGTMDIAHASCTANCGFNIVPSRSTRTTARNSVPNAPLVTQREVERVFSNAANRMLDALTTLKNLMAHYRDGAFNNQVTCLGREVLAVVEEQCSGCYGQGVCPCSACSGKGHLTCSYCSMNYPKGTGTCQSCNGMKGHFDYNKNWIGCYACGQKGYTQCTYCNGTCKSYCYVCSGRASSTCKGCDGYGSYFVSHILQVDLHPDVRVKFSDVQEGFGSMLASWVARGVPGSSPVPGGVDAFVDLAKSEIAYDKAQPDWSLKGTLTFDFTVPFGRAKGGTTSGPFEAVYLRLDEPQLCFTDFLDPLVRERIAKAVDKAESDGVGAYVTTFGDSGLGVTLYEIASYGLERFVNAGVINMRGAVRAETFEILGEAYLDALNKVAKRHVWPSFFWVCVGFLVAWVGMGLAGIYDKLHVSRSLQMPEVAVFTVILAFIQIKLTAKMTSSRTLSATGSPYAARLTWLQKGACVLYCFVLSLFALASNLWH